MKKKDFEKLINEQELNVDFEKINKKIDYSKYEKEPKKSVVFRFKPAMIFASVVALVVLSFGANYAYCLAYNSYIDNLIDKAIEENVFVKKANNNTEYLNAISSGNLLFTNAKKQPWLEGIFDVALKGDSPTNGPIYSAENPPTQNQDANVILTNTQVKGVDEMDYSKCDGQYIYTVNMDWIRVYDLNGNVVDQEAVLNTEDVSRSSFLMKGLYIKDDYVITVTNSYTKIYTFENCNLELKHEINYETYLDSRLHENKLYLIARDKMDETLPEDEEVYYTSGIKLQQKYMIYSFDLLTNELDKVSNLNAGNVVLYMSLEHIYLSTSVYYKSQDYGRKQITVVSIFDINLEVVGAIKVNGHALNQFSMDEYNGYFRIVTTDAYVDTDARNQLSIYSLETLKEVGSLKKGIGEPKQNVKSVAFDKDTCHVVTYENKDPLYEIDLSDVTKPRIVSIYKAPGYSDYLQKFEVNGEKYLFGLGYLDDTCFLKISIYKETNEGTIQIGEDYVISEVYVSDLDLHVSEINYTAFANHKALFIYQDDGKLYLGWKVDERKYYIFKVDVDAEKVVSIYKEIDMQQRYLYSRCYMISGKLYITDYDELEILDFN